MSKKYVKALFKKVGKKAGQLIGVIGSTDDVDRYGDVVDQESWLLENFRKNPVILWAHNLTFGEDRPPIGKAEDVTMTKNGLEFKIQFDMEDPFAADIYRKYVDGFLSAFSVGFIPHQVDYDEDKRAFRLSQCELLELSAVPVPANPNALNQLRRLSFATRKWETMVAEARKSQGDDEVTAPTKSKGISNDKPVEPEVKGGDSAQSPTSPQPDASLKLVAVVREATRQLQQALALANDAVRTPKENPNKT